MQLTAFALPAHPLSFGWVPQPLSMKEVKELIIGVIPLDRHLDASQIIAGRRRSYLVFNVSIAAMAY